MRGWLPLPQLHGSRQLEFCSEDRPKFLILVVFSIPRLNLGADDASDAGHPDAKHSNGVDSPFFPHTRTQCNDRSFQPDRFCPELPGGTWYDRGL